MSVKELQYSLHAIKKLTSYINSPDILPVKNISKEKIGVRKGFQLSFDYLTGILTIKVLIDFLCRADAPEPVMLFGSTILCEFKFLNYEKIIKKITDNQVDIPDGLMVTLMSVSYSTCRGILAVLTTGTDYSNVLLPLVNPDEFKDMLQSIQVEKKPE